MALREDLVIPQGKSWTSPLWALINEDGSAVSLAGRSVKAQVRQTPRDALVLHEWSTAAGNVAIFDPITVEVALEDGSTAQVETVAIALRVKPSESAAWSWRQGIYDVECTSTTDPDDVWSVVVPSAVRVATEVTR